MGSNHMLAVEEEGAAAPETPDRESLRDLVRGKNINEETFLATDYLNHFNEIIMILELVPSMPDCLEEALEWDPKSYEEHFEQSSFADKELAILAYRHAPQRFKGPFESAIAHMNFLVKDGLTRVGEAVESGDPVRIEEDVGILTRNLKRFIDVCSGIIHGDAHTMDQAEIDCILSG